jgi:ubiquinone/menaquinone biosynthesis C-methylase UbiE
MQEQKSDIIVGWRVKLYDRLMGVFGTRRVYEKALALFNLSEGQQLLDVGCGTGTFLKLVQKKFPLARCMGIDVSADMLTEARKMADSSIVFTEADASALPFPNESIDCVVSFLSFHHMPDGIKIRAVQEIARVLRPGGKCLIVDFGRAETKWGAFNLFFLNWHSFTKGNMALVEQEMTRFGLRKEGLKWHRGFVEFYLARKQQ